MENEERKRKLTDDTLVAMIEDAFKIKAVMIQNEPRKEIAEIIKKY